jgi:hypothetical protein
VRPIKNDIFLKLHQFGFVPVLVKCFDSHISANLDKFLPLLFQNFLLAEFGFWIGSRQAPLDLLDLLLEAGAAVNHARACDGCTALHLCSMRGFAAGVRLLLRKGAADRTLLNRAAQSPLFLAANDETRRALTEY